MTLTKADFVEGVIQSLDPGRKKGGQQFLFPEMDRAFLSRRRAAEIVHSLFETIKATRESGEDVRISGFGKFEVRSKWARKGRNPRTGETLILRSRRTVIFRPSPKLKKMMNMPDAKES
jgi:integration host factor subunit alpha